MEDFMSEVCVTGDFLENLCVGESVQAYAPVRSKQNAAIRKKEKKEIPVFFAADENYLPFLDVCLRSVKEKASKKYNYKIYVLNSGVSGRSAERIMKLDDAGFSISFVDVSERLQEVSKFFQLRDYYTSAIYYRLFIVGLFPQYDKALYLDCDTVMLGDVSELYNYELGNNLIGAVADSAVAAVPEFQKYTKQVLGIDGNKYFNSGVILMNLKQFRAENFYENFYKLLKSYRFVVAPDQDCLNLLCKNKVKYLSDTWNRMPIHGQCKDVPKLIHYNLTMKPWHYDDVMYREYFWQYAEKSEFYQEILAHRAAFTPAMAARDAEGAKNLIVLADAEADREDNYYRLYGDKQ